MFATIVIGIIFATIIFFAAKKSFSDMRKGKCSGCTSCTNSKSCNITQIK